MERQLRRGGLLSNMQRFAAINLVLTCVWASSAGAQVTFRRVIGTGDPLPGAPPGTVMNYPHEAMAVGRWIAFGTISSIGRGIYAWDGESTYRVVDQVMTVPGGAAIVPWPDEGQLDLDRSGTVVFWAGLQQGPSGGSIWRWDAAAGLAAVAQSGDPAVDAPGETILAVQSPRISGSTVYYMAERSDPDTYVSVIVAAPSDGPAVVATPDGIQVLGPVFDAWQGHLLYQGYDSGLPERMWRSAPEEEPEPLIASGDPLLGGLPGEGWLIAQVHFIRFGLGGGLRYGGGSLGTRGYFRLTGPGSGDALIRHGDPEPRTGLPILGLPLSFASATDHRFAFVARTHDGVDHLSLREPDGSFLPILSVGDVLEGEVVSFIELSTKAFADDNTLVAVIHRQTEAAVWIIELPQLGGPSPLEIPTLSLVALVVLVVALGLAGSRALSRSRW